MTASQTRQPRGFTKRATLRLLAATAVLTLASVALAQDDEEDETMAPSPMRMRGTASVTAGGAQDIGYARTTIASGGIPADNALIVEGLLSEHDLPVSGPPCERLFCPLLATGYAPSFDSDRGEIWVQLGFNSNIDLASFERRPLNAAIVLDRSGSMGGEKMEIVRRAALTLLDDLGADDRLALISYASTPEVDRTSRAVDNSDIFERDVRGWSTGGSTNLEGALDLGYREVARHAGNERFENRVFVFTDMLPNVGATGPDSFREQANRWASEGINLTVIGVGSDFGQELGLTLGELRGSNYFYLQDRDEAERRFGSELPFMVTPVAYDVTMTIETAPGFELTGVYGVPEADESGAITTEIKTLFLSQRGGAIVMRFIPSDAQRVVWRPETPIANVSLEYATLQGDTESSSSVARFAMPTFEPEAPVFEQTGPYRAWALVQQSLMMRRSIADFHAGDAELARNRLSDLAGTLRAVAAETGDDSLIEEAELVEQLARNLGS